MDDEIDDLVIPTLHSYRKETSDQRSAGTDGKSEVQKWELKAVNRSGADEERIADVAGVLLDQALLVEGLKLNDPADFVKRLNRLLAK
jgi:hypothetical protein